MGRAHGATDESYELVLRSRFDLFIHGYKESAQILYSFLAWVVLRAFHMLQC